MNLFKIFFAFFIFLNMSLASAEPPSRYENRSGQPLCDLTFIKNYLQAISPDSCENKVKVGGKCLGFSTTDALLMAPFLAGPGGLVANGVRVVGGGVAAGLNAEDPKFKQEEQMSSQTRTKANRYQFQYECSKNAGYMTLNEDIQGAEEKFAEEAFHEIEWLKPFCLKENSKRDEKIKLDKEQCTILQKNISTKDCNENKEELFKETCKKIAKNYFCSPKMSTSSKTISFMKLDSEARNKLLCEDQALYDYYKKLLIGYTETLQKGLKLSNLICRGSKLNSFSIETLQNSDPQTQSRKNNYTVETREDGSFASVLARPEPQELAEDYARWKEIRQKRAENIEKYYPKNDKTTEQYNLDPKYKVPNSSQEILPGDLYMKFENHEVGDQLKNIYFVNGSRFDQKVVAQLSSTRFQDVANQFEGTSHSVDFKNHMNLYTSFYLFADHARECCSEIEPKKRTKCLQKYDGKDIEAKVGSPQTPATAKPTQQKR